MTQHANVVRTAIIAIALLAVVAGGDKNVQAQSLHAGPILHTMHVGRVPDLMAVEFPHWAAFCGELRG